jgi:predicted ATPase
VLIGREAEQVRLAALLDGARRSTSGVFVLRGEAGAGKTTLLDDLVARAGEMLVLRGHGVESEAELPYAGLHQLLRPVLWALDRLPLPQGDALRSVFGLHVGRADERFLVSLAVLSLLGELSESRPVLCVLDDAHWLDRGSIDSLGFVARRLHAERVAMVFAVREPAGSRTLDDLPALRVGALDARAATRLLEEHAGMPVHPDVRRRLIEATAGNPLALVELARTLGSEELRGSARFRSRSRLRPGSSRPFSTGSSASRTPPGRCCWSPRPTTPSASPRWSAPPAGSA